ncbi:hypothetical protein N7457_005967 [Penicillium paradoxum]|uniref:uncharacterized protein n=1 Tax=Penicillium paradoxum TaxID=176176 RepID=UPI0025498E09|nr:uncharacterized protein N7457_005967 [Penicillium paradoxum]KAJ5780807.1 hypothetical protein N7457_005967 [Penicillium paradoxum]
MSALFRAKKHTNPNVTRTETRPSLTSKRTVVSNSQWRLQTGYRMTALSHRANVSVRSKTKIFHIPGSTHLTGKPL